MPFLVVLSDEARKQFDAIAATHAKKHRKVLKTLGLLETNPRHTGLHTHEYVSLKGPAGEKVYEAYVENKTPGAYRAFWYYGPDKDMITVIAITPHP